MVSNKIINTFPYPKNEISYLLWNRNPYEVTRGGSDRLYPGTCFSYPYWLARWNLEGRPSSPPDVSTTTEELTTTAQVVTTEKPTTAQETTTPTIKPDPVTTEAASQTTLFSFVLLFLIASL